MKTLDIGTEVESTRQLMTSLLQDAYSINKAALSRLGWVAVPVESGSHFDSDDAMRIAATANRVGADALVAIPAERLAAEPAGYLLSAAKDEILEFSYKCGLFNYFVKSAGGEFGILCTVDDYFIAVGPENSVEMILGCSIAQGKNAFSEFAGAVEWSDERRQHLMSIVSACTA